MIKSNIYNNILINNVNININIINNHQEDRHPGDQPDFNVSVVGSYRDPLSRQVAEGVLITRCSEEILNSKSEFKQPPIVRVRREVNTGV